jgi:hypothetical protein
MQNNSRISARSLQKYLRTGIEEYPDYRTQGESLPELKNNLKDIYSELTSGNIPGVRRVGEIVVK